jgi:hypothetical protein
MKDPAGYVPRLGDEVTVSGNKGFFAVVAVCAKPESVDVRFVGPQELILRNISWVALKPTSRLHQ